MNTLTDLKSHNPLLAVDVIVRFKKKVVLVERRNTPVGWAIPGGIVEEGERVETAARREIREEINLDLKDLQQWKVFSAPDRDPRGHIVSVCFTGLGEGTLEAHTDAAEAGLFSLHKPLPSMVFDHARILREYKFRDWVPRLRLPLNG